MRITGGNYGIGGKLAIVGDGIEIRGAVSKRMSAVEIESVNTVTRSERDFSILAFLFWGVALGAVGMLILGLFGLVLGIVIAIAAGFSTSKILAVDVQLRDGTSVQAEGWHYEIQKLTRLAAQ